MAPTGVGDSSHAPPAPQPWLELAKIHIYIRNRPVSLCGITASAPRLPLTSGISGMLSLPEERIENFPPLCGAGGGGRGRERGMQQGAWQDQKPAGGAPGLRGPTHTGLVLRRRGCLGGFWSPSGPRTPSPRTPLPGPLTQDPTPRSQVPRDSPPPGLPSPGLLSPGFPPPGVLHWPPSSWPGSQPSCQLLTKWGFWYLTSLAPQKRVTTLCGPEPLETAGCSPASSLGEGLL